MLSGLCNRAQEDGSLTGVRVATGSPYINHLLFADDTMFFIKADKRSRQTLRAILQRYEAASGQMINTEKSSITFSRKTPASLKEAVKNDLQIQKEGGTGKYLGLPEHFGRRKRDMFDSIVTRIKQKASGWSNRHLSSAGKLVMLKSVLSPIPSYSMTCFKLPASLIKRIQSAVTRFMWDDSTGKRKMAWISWDKMAQPKAKGGLGLRDFESFNDAFLGKLSWRILNNPQGLLGKVLLGKYCTDGNLLDCPSRTSESHGWRGILIGGALIKRNAGWLVGDGAHIKVWQDPWLSVSSHEIMMGPPPEAYLNLTVDDLLKSNSREWDVELYAPSQRKRF